MAMKQQITNTIKKAQVGLGALVFSAASTTLYSATVFASDASENILGGVGNTEGTDASSTNNATLGDGIDTVTNLLLFTIGVIAVIAIIIGGIRYATANGDQSHVTQGKNIVLYAVVGLVIALIAYAITRFVIDAFS